MIIFPLISVRIAAVTLLRFSCARIAVIALMHAFDIEYPLED